MNRPLTQMEVESTTSSINVQLTALMEHTEKVHFGLSSSFNYLHV